MRAKFFVMAMAMLLVCSVGSIAAAQQQEQNTDTELQKFQGTWVMVSAEMDGKKVHDKHVKKSKLTFVGDKVEIIAPHQHKDKIVATIMSAAVRKCTKSGGLKMRVKNGSKSSHWRPLSGSSDRLITEAESFRFRLFPSFDSFCPQ